MKGQRLLIFSVSHKYEYKLFVFEYFNSKITTLKKYKNIHSSTLSLPDLITDFHVSGKLAISVSRDKRVNAFDIKFL